MSPVAYLTVLMIVSYRFVFGLGRRDPDDPSFYVFSAIYVLIIGFSTAWLAYPFGEDEREAPSFKSLLFAAFLIPLVFLLIEAASGVGIGALGHNPPARLDRILYYLSYPLVIGSFLFVHRQAEGKARPRVNALTVGSRRSVAISSCM